MKRHRANQRKNTQHLGFNEYPFVIEEIKIMRKKPRLQKIRIVKWVMDESPQNETLGKDWRIQVAR